MEDRSEYLPDADGREITSSIAEHEVLLSFNSDWMAEAFGEWWYNFGSKTWAEWAVHNEEHFK